MPERIPARRGHAAPNGRHRQQGAALLVFMLVFFLAATSWLLSRVDSASLRNEANRTTNAALAQAKDALLGRAVADKDQPGTLPCPDLNDDGETSLGSCTATIGHLPWKTLDLPDLRDGDGNRLWYVLDYKLDDKSSATKVNPAMSFDLSLDGNANVAAIVFAAGPPLAGQNGRPGNNVADYLDGANATGGPYVSGPTSPTFNDKTIAISHDQLFGVVNRRILGMLTKGLQTYYANNGSYPPEGPLTASLAAADFGDNTNLLSNNGWYALVDYAPTADRQQATLTVNVPPSNRCTITPTQTSCTLP